MSDGMGREFTYLSSHATYRYFIPNWGNYYVNTAISTLNLKKAGYLCLMDSYLEWNPK